MKSIKLVGLIVVTLLSFYPLLAETDNSIELGVLLPLSGDLSIYGQSELNGAMLATEILNREGGVAGKNIKLIIHDNAFSTKQQVSALNKVIQTNSVKGLVTAWTPLTLPIVPIIDRYKLPTFTWSAFDMGYKSPFLFNTKNDFAQSAISALGVLCKDDIERGVYLSVRSPEVESIDSAIRTKSKKCKLSLLDEKKFNPSDTDFRTLLMKLKKVGPKALILCAFPHQFPLIIRQAAQLGMDSVRLLDVCSSAPDPTFPKNLHPVLSKMRTISTWYSMNPDVESTASFIASYKKRFGEAPAPYAAYAFDAVNLLVEAIADCENRANDQPECISEALLGVQNRYGAAGLGSMDEDGDLELPISIVRFVENSWNFLDF